MRHDTPFTSAASWLTLLALSALMLPACGGEGAETPDPIALSAAPVVDSAVSSQIDLDPQRPVIAPLPALEPLATELPDSREPAWTATLDIGVRHGETLVVLADQAGCTAEDLALLNGFDVTHMLRAGDRILVPVDRVDAETLQTRRAESLARRLDRYLRGRGGSAGVATHRVRTGETGWGIARDVVSVPMWVLASYNPDVDLDRLSIGDSLQVPVMLDTVAGDTVAGDTSIEVSVDELFEAEALDRP